MTIHTNGNDVKPVFWRIAVPMMIFFGGLWTIMALQRIGMGQFTISDSIINGINCLSAVGMVDVVSLIIFLFACSTLIALAVSVFCCFPFFGFAMFSLCNHINRFTFFGCEIMRMICRNTQLAIRIMTIFFTRIFMKLHKRFDFFAFGTSFRYDLLSHNRLLVRRLRLEPSIEPISMSGSLYSKQTSININNILQKNR